MVNSCLNLLFLTDLCNSSLFKVHKTLTFSGHNRNDTTLQRTAKYNSNQQTIDKRVYPVFGLVSVLAFGIQCKLFCEINKGNVCLYINNFSHALTLNNAADKQKKTKQSLTQVDV